MPGLVAGDLRAPSGPPGARLRDGLSVPADECAVSGKAAGDAEGELTVMAIDPGYEQSAWVLFDGRRVVDHGIEPNEDLLQRLTSGTWRLETIQATVIEGIESFGMAVGREVFETVFWTGRFFERGRHKALRVERMFRKTVKVHLCQSSRAQDSNIRVALIDRFGGSDRAVGKKAAPGPLYGIKSHEWAALAIAVTWWDQQQLQKQVSA